MSGDEKGNKRADTQDRAQVELNRQALVSFGKRLAEIEAKISLADNEISGLRKHAGSTLQTIRRLQEIVEKLIKRERAKGSKL